MKKQSTRGWCRSGGGAALLLALALVGCSDRNDAAGGGKAAAPSNATQSTVTPEAIQAALDAAESYLAGGKIPEAETIAVELVKKSPQQWKAHELYGRILYLRGNQAKRAGQAPEAIELIMQAYEEYRAAAELSPESAGLQHSAGMMALAAGDEAAALAHIQKAGRLEPDNPQYPLHEAQILITRRSLDEAEATLARVLAIDPDEPFAHASLAAIALERGDIEKAIELITKARSVDSTNVALRIQEAKIRRRAGQPMRALELLVPLSEKDRGNETVASEIAASYALLGRHADAARAWETCFGKNEKSWRAAVRAAEAYVAAGDKAKAATWIQTAELIAPDEPEVKDLRRKLSEK